MWSKSDWKALQKPACKFQQVCNSVRGLLLSTLDTGILLSALNTCVEFAPVAMESAKCSAEITSVGVYTGIANLKILFLWGREINILSKCWKWDGTLHVSKHNLSDKVRATLIVSALLHFISIFSTWYSGKLWGFGCNCTNPKRYHIWKCQVYIFIHASFAVTQ